MTLSDAARDLILEMEGFSAKPVLIAEVFYKFHSFALETLAFLATWWGLSWVQKAVTGLVISKEADHARETR